MTSGKGSETAFTLHASSELPVITCCAVWRTTLRMPRGPATRNAVSTGNIRCWFRLTEWWHPGVKLVKSEVRGREVRKESKVKAFQKELDNMV